MTLAEAFFVAMTGAAIGGLLSLFVQRWRYEADQWAVRATELSNDRAIGGQGVRFLAC
jgi:hypothetical protein